MFSIYIKSIIVYWIILLATCKIAKINLEGQDINLNDYFKKKTTKSGLSIPLISAVPIFRFVIFLVLLFLTVSTKETLDKIFLNEEE